MNVVLHIDKIVVDGLDVAPSQRELLRGALASELTRRLAEGGLAPSIAEGGATPSLRGPSIDASGSRGPTDLAGRIAGSIYGGIGR